MRFLIALICVLQTALISTAVAANPPSYDISVEGLGVLEILGLKDQKFSDPRYPSLHGYEYKMLYSILLETNGDHWAKEIYRLYVTEKRPVSKSDIRMGIENINTQIGQSLRNKVSLFATRPTQMQDHELKEREVAREVLDFAFKIAGLSKNTVYGNVKIAGQYRQVNLYHLLIESYLRADHNTFVTPINFFNAYKHLMQEYKTNSNLDINSYIDRFYLEPGTFRSTAHEFLKRYGLFMNEAYLSSVGNFARPASTVELTSNRQLDAITRRFAANILFLGHGSKSQFADIDSTLKQIDRLVANLNATYGSGNWLAVFGGDSYNASKPDIAHVMKRLSELGVKVLAIQSDAVKDWGGVDKYIDYVKYVPTTTIPELTADGREIIENGKVKTKIVWGGFVNGKAAGPTATYLGSQFTQGPNPILKSVVVIGGGPIALEETRYAHDLKIPIKYIAAETMFPEVNGKFGSVHEWAIKNITDSSSTNSCKALFSN